MRKVLRSVLYSETNDDDRDEIRTNIPVLIERPIHFTAPEDREIWEYARTYYRSHGHAPSFSIVREQFDRKGKASVLDRLEDIEAIDNPFVGADFKELVQEYREEHLDSEALNVLQTAGQIVHNGLEVEDEKLEGSQDAFDYILREADDFLTTDQGTEIRKELTTDYDGMQEEFQQTLENPRDAWGVITLLDEIDETCRGVKNGELWLHAGFTGEFKTSMALNWAWKACTQMCYNVYYYTLEMPYEQIRRIIYVMHSNHTKFQEMGYEPLNYRVIRDGVHDDGSPITQEEIDFFNLVCEDFKECEGEEYGRFIVERPSDGGTTIPTIKQRMEVADRQQPIHIGFIDYLGLVEPSQNTRDYYTGMNSILREAKQFALNFREGDGIPLVALHQMNRDGKEDADKNDGRYKLQALADANEAERSSDVITYTYANNELRDNEEIKIGCLKNRDNPQFSQFHAGIHLPSRFIHNLDTTRELEDAENVEKYMDDS